MQNELKHDMLISMPAHRGVPEFETNICLTQALRYMGSKKYKVAFNAVMGSNLSRNRNTGVEEAQNANAKFLMFIDDDMVFDPEWMERLMLHDKPIVAGLYVKKFYPYTPNARRLDEDGRLGKVPDLHSGGLVRVDACGTGFLLIKVSVFEGLKKPYFCFPATDRGTVQGEDYYFCEQARNSGFSIWVDMDMHVGHLGKYPFSIGDHLGALQIESDKAMKKQEEKRIEVVGANVRIN